MPIRFNRLLADAGIDPKAVALLRHKDGRTGVKRPPFVLWRDDPTAFEDYQRHQAAAHRARLRATYWASFVGTPEKQTLFVGLYRVRGLAASSKPWLAPHTLAMEIESDVYDLEPMKELSDLAGLLSIEWGPGLRTWVQRAGKRDKPVLELRRERSDPPFPGYMTFMAQLSELEALPAPWASALAAIGGVYLLTCPRTNEQYVGAALGADGFLGRWREYASSGHGDNVALKSRDRSDYRVSILEVAGSAAGSEAVLAMEARWKAKLQSREMGLNRN